MVTNFSNTAVDTTLNGAITNVATSLVVVSATGYPAVPFNIQIENEVIRVGAKSVTTFSTLTRGYDGTTGVSHVDGSAVSHVVIAEDIPPKYGSYILGDVPPETADADDDEFDDESFTGWTTQYVGQTPIFSELADGLLYVDSAPDVSAWALKTASKALPGSGNWKYELAVHAHDAFNTSGMPITLCLLEGTTAQGVYVFGSMSDRLKVVRLDDYSTLNSVIVDAAIQATQSHNLEVQYLVGNGYKFLYTINGSVNSVDVNSGFVTLPFTPTAIAIGFNTAIATWRQQAIVKWFRRTA